MVGGPTPMKPAAWSPEARHPPQHSTSQVQQGDHQAHLEFEGRILPSALLVGGCHHAMGIPSLIQTPCNALEWFPHLFTDEE